MTPSQLKYNVESKTDSYHFIRSTMDFFGDSMRNYGVRSSTINTNYDADGRFVGGDGIPIEVWELYRKRVVKHNMKGSAYFNKVTFESVSKV